MPKLDWDALLRGERMTHDFKRSMPFSGQDRERLLKPLIAMGNIAGGGHVIVGVAEIDGTHVVEGLDAKDLATYDVTPINEYVSKWIDPTSRIRVEKDVVEGKNIVLLQVPEFEAEPHICGDGPNDPDDLKKKLFYAGDMLVRNEKGQTVRVQSSEEMRALLRRALGKTSDALLHDIRRIIEGRVDTRTLADPLQVHSPVIQQWSATYADFLRQINGGGVYGVRVFPDVVLDVGDHERLKLALQRTNARAAGIQFPASQYGETFNRDGCIEGRNEVPGYKHVWQLHGTGAFVYVGQRFEESKWTEESMTREGLERADYFIHSSNCHRYALTLLFFKRLYSDLGFDGPLSYDVEWSQTLDNRLLFNDPAIWDPKAYVCRDPQIIRRGATSVLDLRSGWRERAVRELAGVCRLFQVNDPEPTTRKRVEEVRD
jgi:hypothetical protein